MSRVRSVQRQIEDRPVMRLSNQPDRGIVVAETPTAKADGSDLTQVTDGEARLLGCQSGGQNTADGSETTIQPQARLT